MTPDPGASFTVTLADVYAAVRKGVEIRGKCRDERLTFTRSHLGDAALVKSESADQLHIEMPHSEDASRSLSNRRESLGKYLMQDLLLSLSPLALILDPFES